MKKILFLLPLILALLVSGTVEAKKKKYPNEDYYEGKWKKGNPNGIGINMPMEIFMKEIGLKENPLEKVL